MPIAKEILNMLDVGQKPFQSILSQSLALNRKGKVFPLCDASFRSPIYAHQQAFIALWVHPFTCSLPGCVCSRFEKVLILKGTLSYKTHLK